MTRREALIELRDKVKAGEAHEVQVVAKMIASAARDTGNMFPQNDVVKAYNGSFDAAKALHDALLPPINQYTIDEGPSGCGCHLCIWPDGLSGERELQFKGLAETPARAWLLAILEALISTDDRPSDH
jgi:hypothetical protein